MDLWTRPGTQTFKFLNWPEIKLYIYPPKMKLLQSKIKLHLHFKNIITTLTFPSFPQGATVVKRFVSESVPSTVPFRPSVRRSHSEDQNRTLFQRFPTKLVSACRHFPWQGTVYLRDTSFLVVRGLDRMRGARFRWLRGLSRSVKVMHLFCGRYDL